MIHGKDLLWNCALAVVVAASTGCAVSGFARDLGTNTSDTYNDYRTGNASANRATAFSRLYPSTFATVGTTALPDGTVLVEARTGPSNAPRPDTVAEAQATASHDTSFTISRSGNYFLDVAVQREHAVATSGDAEAFFEWTISVRNSSTGAEVMKVVQVPANRSSSTTFTAGENINTTPGWRNATGALDQGVTYVLSVRAKAYAKTTKRALPEESEVFDTGGFTVPYGNAEVDLYYHMGITR